MADADDAEDGERDFPAAPRRLRPSGSSGSAAGGTTRADGACGRSTPRVSASGGSGSGGGGGGEPHGRSRSSQDHLDVTLGGARISRKASAAGLAPPVGRAAGSGGGGGDSKGSGGDGASVTLPLEDFTAMRSRLGEFEERQRELLETISRITEQSNRCVWDVWGVWGLKRMESGVLNAEGGLLETIVRIMERSLDPLPPDP
eukprot:353046-Chlamydomonas_euryale.AAC.2